MESEVPLLGLCVKVEPITKELDAPDSGDAGLLAVHFQLEHVLKISGSAFERPFRSFPAGA
ncbi:hypothetical protein SDC9_76032 [bioreactor metagenome]|uniref:Uncharacterized protein n=1 Tax=bioreactor metagenome TaxID=1076179 RepID=A0A644YLI2_9ZZZZ